MTLTIIDWPAGLPVASADWFLDGAQATSGPGLDGRAQWVGKEDRKWVATVTVPSLNFDQMEEFKIMIDNLRGPLNILKFPVRNPLGLSGASQADLLAMIGVDPIDIANGFEPFDDGEVFDDGEGFELPEFAPASVLLDALEGECTLNVDGLEGLAMPRKSLFEINNFIYRVWQSDLGTLHFHPPLREDVAAGTVLNTSDIFIYVRLANDRSGRVTSRYEMYSDANKFDVIEAFQR